MWPSRPSLPAGRRAWCARQGRVSRWPSIRPTSTFSTGRREVACKAKNANQFERRTSMQRRQLLKSTAALSAATLVSAPAIAQAPRKISFLTWNLVHLEAHIKGWIQGFTASRPGVEVEWIDKKGPEVPVYYATQLPADTRPDVIDIQAALGLEDPAQRPLA